MVERWEGVERRGAGKELQRKENASSVEKWGGKLKCERRVQSKRGVEVSVWVWVKFHLSGEEFLQGSEVGDFGEGGLAEHLGLRGRCGGNRDCVQIITVK